MRIAIKVLELCKAKVGTGISVPVNCKLMNVHKSFQLTSTGTTTAVIHPTGMSPSLHSLSSPQCVVLGVCV